MRFLVCFRYRLVVLVLTTIAAFPVSAGDRVVGWVERVKVMALGVTTKAKLDSGALTSSIHAADVKRFRRGQEKWVRFTVSLTDADTREVITKTLERPFHRRVKLTGAGGVDHRLVVLMDICIGKQVLREQVSLSNRSDKNYGLLIGRRTLEHIGLLDVQKTFTLEPRCKSS